jgi:hypothetical protein
MNRIQQWKYAWASVTGTSHLAGNLPCQDASECEVVSAADGSQILLAAVSDGAGSAARAEAGSSLTCASFIEKAKDYFATGRGIQAMNESFAFDWLSSLQQKLKAIAQAEKLDPGEFASTVVAAVVGEDESLFLHIGDGAIVASRRAKDDYRCISWPQQGEYVNSTHFVTDLDALDKITLSYDGAIDELAIFSDGIQHMVLEYENQLAHDPFFISVFSWLQVAHESTAQSASRSLGEYLNSSKVNDRTDDDKSLILATRRSPAPRK